MTRGASAARCRECREGWWGGSPMLHPELGSRGRSQLGQDAGPLAGAPRRWRTAAQAATQKPVAASQFASQFETQFATQRASKRCVAVCGAECGATCERKVRLTVQPLRPRMSATVTRYAAQTAPQEYRAATSTSLAQMVPTFAQMVGLTFLQYLEYAVSYYRNPMANAMSARDASARH